MNTPAASLYELEVTEGLEALARREVTGRLHVKESAIDEGRGWLRFPSGAAHGRLAELRLAESVFSVLTFDVPRPRALLGDQHFKRLVAAINEATAGFHPKARTFDLAAAGSDSSVMLRLRQELTKSVNLTDSEGEPADVQLRLMRARSSEGWDALLRITPRPLSARAWRVCSFPGALNATVAHAMAQLTRPQANDVFVNLMSGSASLLIERLDQARAGHAAGLEIDPQRLACARRNLDAARLTNAVVLMQADAQSVPFASSSADALCADLPFGQRVGTHRDNERLYPRLLAEAARIARPGARFVLLTHEVSLMDALLRDQRQWVRLQMLPLNLRGLHPRIYVLERA